MNLKAIGKTNIGKIRQNNEDNIFLSLTSIGVFPNLFIVADGMGGHNAGEIASSKAIEFFRQKTKELNEDILDALISSVQYANEMTFLTSVENSSLYGMGTTFTVCVIKDDKAYLAHVGDSRAYLISEKKIHLITNDHTYVEELVKAGQISRAKARKHPKRNMLTRALGVDPALQVDGYTQELVAGDRLLICSDGLTAMLTDEEIYRITRSDITLEEQVDQLIDQANEKGGMDNISVILILNDRQEG